MSIKKDERFSPYITFDREAWMKLRDKTPLPLSQAELDNLRSLNDRVSLEEVAEIYLPLSRLLGLYVESTQSLHAARNTFLGNPTAKVPYMIGIAGSVAVGKSTTARIIQTLLKRWPDHPKVDLITTDGFLYPNEELEKRGIMHRKGFPESYDVRKLLRFVSDLKSGRPEVAAPVYSHLTYDIVPGEFEVIRQPDIVVVEGLNVLQTGSNRKPGMEPRLFVSDFFDFSIYVDADASNIKTWYIERFQTLRYTAFSQPNSFFRRFATLSDEEAIKMASQIWHDINEINLRENIEPTKYRAHLILRKGAHHRVEHVRMRKL